ncbi:MAG: hypothetical protein O2807_06965 [bacterium]|nr:hypothetical protein [bacterium]
MSAAQNRPPRGGNGGLPIGRHAGGSLSSGAVCPCLSSTDRDMPYERPSGRNICRAQSRVERHGFKRVTIPFAKVTRERQTQLCLMNFRQCEHYLQQEGKPPPAGMAAALPSKSQKAAYASSPRKKHRKHSKAFRTHDSTQQTLKQIGQITLVSTVLAFAVSLYYAGSFSALFESLAYSVLRNQAQNLGLTEKEVDQARKAGLLKAKNLMGLKNMSKSQQNKLKNSAVFNKLSGTQKKKLKAMYKKQAGK